jgi:hypothetical protein
VYPVPLPPEAVKLWLAPTATVTWEGETASAAVAMLTVTVAVAVWLAESVHADHVRDAARGTGGIDTGCGDGASRIVGGDVPGVPGPAAA